MGFGEIIGAIIGGAVIGILGKLVAPGSRDNIPLWLTIVCGVGGIFLGTYAWVALGGQEDGPGFDWWRHLTQIVVAAVLVVIAASVAGRKRA